MYATCSTRDVHDDNTLGCTPDLDPLRVGRAVGSDLDTAPAYFSTRASQRALLREHNQSLDNIILPSKFSMSLPLGEAKSLVAELCRLFYDQGWVSGTGGGISIRASTDEIVMAPSGVQKERMDAEDMFVLNAAGEVVHTPVAKPAPNRAPKLSECSPLFMAVGKLFAPSPWSTHMHPLLRNPTKRCTHDL